MVKSNVTWMDIHSGTCEGKQNGWQVCQYGYHSISVVPWRGRFTKNPRYKASDCSAEAIRRSSWLICYCFEKPDTHTNTANYCNPAACMPRAIKQLLRKCNGLQPSSMTKYRYHNTAVGGLPCEWSMWFSVFCCAGLNVQEQDRWNHTQDDGSGIWTIHATGIYVYTVCM